MNWVDFTIIGVIILSALISIIRGFVKEALSLISWVLAFFIASRFYMYITSYLTYFDSDVIRIAVAIAILFISTLIVCAIISYIIGQLVQKTGLSGTDRVLGICFGIIRGTLVVAAVLFFVDTFTPLSQTLEWEQSLLIPHFQIIIRWFFDLIQHSSSFLVK
jgi:Uncharacterized membrane protein, required for colicin V production